MRLVQLAKTVVLEAKADNLTGESAKVAYYVFAAFFPFILALLALTGLFGGDQAFAWIMGHLRGALPTDAAKLLQDFVFSVTHSKKPGALSIGVLLTLWSASNIFSALGDGLNVAYDVTETRSWFRRKLVSFGLVIAAVFLLITAAVILVAGPAIGRALHLGFVWTMISIPLPFVLLLAMLWLTYFFLPNRDQRHAKRQVLMGAVVGSVLWLVVTVLFRFYVSNFGHYDKTYGVLGGVIILLLWLYLTALSMLLGGEVAQVLESQTESEEDEALRYAA